MGMSLGSEAKLMGSGPGENALDIRILFSGRSALDTQTEGVFSNGIFNSLVEHQAEFCRSALMHMFIL